MKEKNLILRNIKKFDLNLSDLTVFTNINSENRTLLPLAAIQAGAKKVYAHVNNIDFTENERISNKIIEFYRNFDNFERIRIVNDFASVCESDIITDIPFNDPEFSEYVPDLNRNSVFIMIFSKWHCSYPNEYLTKNFLFFKPNFHHPELEFERYFSISAIKLLFDLDLDIFKNRIIIAGGGLLAESTSKILRDLGSEVILVCPEEFMTSKLKAHKHYESFLDGEVLDSIKSSDALLFLNDISCDELVGSKGEISFNELYELNPELRIAHVSGNIDINELKNSGLFYRPLDLITSPNKMSLPVDYLNVKPLIKLSVAGLKTGEIAARAMIKNNDMLAARDEALRDFLVWDYFM